MEQYEIREMLEQVAGGQIGVEDAMLKLKMAPFENIDIASLDTHRSVRQGASEVIYGAGKTPEQIIKIARTLWQSGQRTIMITRMDREKAAAFQAANEGTQVMAGGAALAAAAGTAAMDSVKETAGNGASAERLPFTYDEISHIGLIGEKMKPRRDGYILVATGGTSDIPVAEEAAQTAEILGNHVERIYDVGVAGIHRLLAHADKIMQARVIIAIAGMEGALASVIGGLADCPVIAVPTSVGYGTAFGGVTALLSMLNSCASGVSVVNIDNGFGAGYLANLSNNMEA